MRKAGKDDKLRKQLAGRREKALERGSGLMRNSKGHRYKRNGIDNAGKFNTLLREIGVVEEERPVRFFFESAVTRTAATGAGGLVAVDGLEFAYPAAASAAAAAAAEAATSSELGSAAGGSSGGFRLRLRNLNIVAGERVVLLGPNGHGKSTLVKLLTGELVASAGSAYLTPSCGYFAQSTVARLGLEQRTALELALAAVAAVADLGGAGGGREEAARKALGAFGLGPFGATPVALLSGGQCVALQFALISVRQPALLLLDEPSAHLDLEAREGLAAALAAFDGAVLVISHDIGFVELLRPTRGILCRAGAFTEVEDWRAAALAL